MLNNHVLHYYIFHIILYIPLQTFRVYVLVVYLQIALELAFLPQL